MTIRGTPQWPDGLACFVLALAGAGFALYLVFRC